MKSQTSQHSIDPAKTSEKTAIKVVKKVMKMPVKNPAKPKSPIPEKKVVKNKSDGNTVRQVTVKPNQKNETSSSSKVSTFHFLLVTKPYFFPLQTLQIRK